MTRASMLNVRIHDELKIEAAEVLSNYGLTLSDAVRIFLTSVAKKKSLPAELVMNDEAFEKWLGERLEQSLNNRGASRPAREFLKSL